MVAGREASPSDVKHTEQLRLYWTKGEGAAKWVASPHPWTTLHALLLAIPLKEPLATRLTETYFVEVFGFHSGSRKGKNPVGPG